jgi:hypothetical protein
LHWLHANIEKSPPTFALRGRKSEIGNTPIELSNIKINVHLSDHTPFLTNVQSSIFCHLAIARTIVQQRGTTIDLAFAYIKIRLRRSSRSVLQIRRNYFPSRAALM